MQQKKQQSNSIEKQKRIEIIDMKITKADTITGVDLINDKNIIPNWPGHLEFHRKQ